MKYYRVYAGCEDAGIAYGMVEAKHMAKAKMLETGDEFAMLELHCGDDVIVSCDAGKTWVKRKPECNIWKAMEDFQEVARTHEQSEYAKKAAGDIFWYINTRRASMDFENAFKVLPKRQMRTLLNRILPYWDCTEKVIREAKKYLRVQ